MRAILQLLRDNKFTAALSTIGVSVALAFGLNGEAAGTIISSIVTVILAVFGSAQDTKQAQ